MTRSLAIAKKNASRAVGRGGSGGMTGTGAGAGGGGDWAGPGGPLSSAEAKEEDNTALEEALREAKEENDKRVGDE